MRVTTGSTRDLLPQGEEFRRAVRWIAERRKEDPRANPLQVVDEASTRFDLTPLQAEYLLASVRGARR